MHRDRLGRRHRPELVAQQRPQAIEHEQPLGDVALQRQRLHQQRVAGLAVWLGLDQVAGRALDGRELRPAHAQPRAPNHLQRTQPHVLELAPAGLEPARLRAGQQAAAGDVERDLRERPGAAHVAALQRLLRSLHLDDRRLDVDPHGLGKHQAQLVAAGERRRSEHRAQPRQQRPQRRVLRARRLEGPQRPDQLLASDVAIAVEDEVGEQQRHLPTAERIGHLHAVDLDRQPPTELNPRAFTDLSFRWQRSGNVSTTAAEDLARQWKPGHLHPRPSAGRSGCRQAAMTKAK